MQLFGQEVKPQVLWVVGGVVVAGVVFYLVRGNAAPADAAPQAPPDDGGYGGGGGGGSIPIQAPTPISDPFNAQLEQVQLDAAKFGLAQQQREADQAGKQFDLAFTLNQAYGQMQMALFGQQTQVGETYAAYQKEANRTAQAAQGIVQKSIAGKSKVECPVGQHFVVLADGSTACQAKGGGGFNLSTITKGIADVVTGVFKGAAAAAPGIGYAGAQYGAAQAGIIPGKGQASQIGGSQQGSQQSQWQTQQGQRQPYQTSYTPPIAPSRPNDPFAVYAPNWNSLG